MNAANKAGDAAYIFLEAVAAASDAFPPLKSASAGALHIANLCKSFKSNKKQWSSFSDHVQAQAAIIIRALLDDSPSTGTDNSLLRLKLALDSVVSEIVEVRSQRGVRRVFTFAKDPTRIDSLRRQLSEALQTFHLESALDNSRTLKDLRDTNVTELIQKLVGRTAETAEKLDKHFSESSLKDLAYVDGASWQPELACLPGTRSTLLANVRSWILEKNEDSPRCVVLADTAGSGKSAFSHTLAMICHTVGILGSSFFFRQSVAGRNSTERVIATLVRDMASRNFQYAGIISQLLDADRSLASTTSPYRQLNELVVKPFARLPLSRPCVLVIDALDEGADKHFLEALRATIPQLPAGICIFLTTRPEQHIISSVTRWPMTTLMTLNILETENLMDIGIYSRHRLSQVATDRGMDPSWPSEALLIEFVKKSEGLFQWVFAVTQFLLTYPHPDRKLRSLLDSQVHDAQSLMPERKMDALYTQILAQCPWDDADFRKEYQLVLGTIIAAKTPLSARAIQLLHADQDTLDVKAFLPYISSILISGDAESPARILHLSFAEFVSSRADAQKDTRRFAVDEIEHSQSLAHLCVRTMIRHFADHMPCTQFQVEGLGDQGDSGPESVTTDSELHIQVSEVVAYACRFWMNHLLDVDHSPHGELVTDLRVFMSEHFDTWLETIVSIDRFQSMTDTLSWFKESALSELVIEAHTELLLKLNERLVYADRLEEAFDVCQDSVVSARILLSERGDAAKPHLAKSLVAFSDRSFGVGQRVTALGAIREAVELYRELAFVQPNVFNQDLALSLNNLSGRLSDLGHREEALSAIQESFQLRLRLTLAQPTRFDLDLAVSLGHFSHSLSNLEHTEEEPLTILEAVDVLRHHELARPSTYVLDLAWSLDNLSNRLKDLGHREQALVAIQNAVALRRVQALSRPTKYDPELAWSLDALSCCFADLGRREEALAAIQEAMTPRRALALARPAAFNPELASSLTTLSRCLSDLGHREEALLAIRETVGLYRELTLTRPAVFIPHLAKSLNNLSLRLSDLGHREEALLMNQKAVKLRRELARAWPAVFNVDLAYSLHNLSCRLFDLGHADEALSTIQEAAMLRRELALARPRAYNQYLALSLNHWSFCLSGLGRHEEGLSIIQEAVELRRKLARVRPAVFNPELAGSLHLRAVLLNNLGRLDEAVISSRQAAELRRDLAVDRPANFTVPLKESLENLACYLSAVGKDSEASVTREEAGSLQRDC